MADITGSPQALKAAVKGRAAPQRVATTVHEKDAVAPAKGALAPAAGRLRGAAKASVAFDRGVTIAYLHAQGVGAFVERVANATPMELVEVERRGVQGAFLKDLSKHMGLPAIRIYDIVGIPKATAEKKVAANEPIAGASGQAALGLAQLLAMAKSIVDNSASPEAKGFDAAKWLGRWIERPQPALGGRKPADLIATPTGLDMVARVMGAIESGAYQ